ncbi:MAG: hypothetical protein AAFN78_03555, partial [Pseudomonadota bacterium]
ACSRGQCATMGETLKVRRGARVTVGLAVQDPKGNNRSPYTFNNPVLMQIGIEQPLNQPELAHVELIRGDVNGPIPVRLDNGKMNPEYSNPLAPETTHIARQWTTADFGSLPTIKRMSYSFIAETDGYVRARGSNLPPGTPNARDMDGNPLSDKLKDNVTCDDPLCPPHVEGIVNYDLEAWSDMWFHTNPVFIEVE